MNGNQRLAKSGILGVRFLERALLIQSIMPSKSETTVRKAAEPDLDVGLVCADRDGNRIRIDRINTDAGARTISYHFLNDELRVQEGIQERSIEQFLADGWYMAAPGKSL